MRHQKGREMSKCWYPTILEEGELLNTNIHGESDKAIPRFVEYVTENESGIVVLLTFRHGSYRRHIQWADLWMGEVKMESAERRYEIEAKGDKSWEQFMR